MSQRPHASLQRPRSCPSPARGAGGSHGAIGPRWGNGAGVARVQGARGFTRRARLPGARSPGRRASLSEVEALISLQAKLARHIAVPTPIRDVVGVRRPRCVQAGDHTGTRGARGSQEARQVACLHLVVLLLLVLIGVALVAGIHNFLKFKFFVCCCICSRRHRNCFFYSYGMYR